MRKLTKAIALLALSQSLWAEPKLSLNGEPFPGRIEWSSSGPWIEIEALAHQAGWARHPAYSGWCYRRHDEGEACPSKDLIGKGQIFLEGERVDSRVVDGRTLVSLETAKRLFQLDVTSSSSTDWALKLPPGPGGSELPVQPPSTQTCNLDGKLKAGKVHVALFYTQWCPSCWKYFPTLETLARTHPEVELVEMDIGEFGSPMCQQYSIRATPWLRILDDRGQTTADGNAAESWLQEKYGVTMPTSLKCVGAPGR